MKVVLRVTGDAEIARKAMTTAQAANVMAPALKKVGDIVRNAAKGTFQSQGRRGGGSWRHLKPATVRRKQREGQPAMIMWGTGALYRSLTTGRSPRHIQRIEGDKIKIGTTLPYASIQNRTRPLIKLTTKDKREMKKAVADHLLGHWRGRRRKPSTW